MSKAKKKINVDINQYLNQTSSQGVVNPAAVHSSRLQWIFLNPFPIILPVFGVLSQRIKPSTMANNEKRS